MNSSLEKNIMKKHLLLFVLFIGVTAQAQSELNAYKYIVIPSKFDFQKESNEYGLNLLLKYKFQQLGFETYLDTDDLPQELRINTCLYASPVLHAKSNMFKTTVSVELFDCGKKSLYRTQEGSSSSKNFKASYNEAVRKSLNSFQDYKLDYRPGQETVQLALKDDNLVADSTAEKEIEKLKEEVATLKQQNKEIKDVPSSVIYDKVVKTEIVLEEVKSYLFAQPIINGYVLVDSKTNEIVYSIYNTKMKNVFVLEGKIGVVYKIGASWVREYVDKEKIMTEFLEIKF